MSDSCCDNNDSALPIGITGATGATGTTGADGADGTNGTTVLYNNITPASTTNGTVETLHSYNMPANTLVSNGDSIEIISYLDVDLTSGYAEVRVAFGGVVIHTAPINLISPHKSCLIRAIITKQSAIQASAQITAVLSEGINFSSTISYSMFNVNILVTNFAAITNVSILAAETDTVNVVTARSTLILKYKI